MIRALVIAAAALCLALPAKAQQSRYTQWSSPDQPAKTASELQDFRDKLNALVDEAEKARAADPRFLQDLRDLANGKQTPARRLILEDSFADGDFTQNPAWTVTGGSYFIEQGWGLRNKVQAGQSADRELTNEEKAIKLFGAILTGKAQQTSSEPGVTAIHSLAAVPNEFSITADIYTALNEGRFALAAFQGADRSAGYRLVYGVGDGFALQRFSSRGTSVITTGGKTLSLEDKKFHTVTWNRAKDGAMTVSVDGAEVLSAPDRGFRDPFQGIEMATRGGDFIVKKIQVFGTP